MLVQQGNVHCSGIRSSALRRPHGVVTSSLQVVSSPPHIPSRCHPSSRLFRQTECPTHDKGWYMVYYQYSRRRGLLHPVQRAQPFD